MAEIWQAVLLVGPTGSGKTPFGRILEAKGFRGRRCFHFDFGARLREIGATAGAGEPFSSDDMAIVRRSLETGALFEEEDFPLALRILSDFVRKRDVTPLDLLVLNGFPRHRGQAEGLEGVVSVVAILLLDCPAAVIRERIRRDTGGDRCERKDDALEAVAARLKLFEERTMPLLGFYGSRGVPLIRIPVGERTTAEDMFENLEAGD